MRFVDGDNSFFLPAVVDNHNGMPLFADVSYIYFGLTFHDPSQ